MGGLGADDDLKRLHFTTQCEGEGIGRGREWEGKEMGREMKG